MIFNRDLHKAVLHRIQEVLAATNCTAPLNWSLSDGAFDVKVKQLYGNLFLFGKAIVFLIVLKL